MAEPPSPASRSPITLQIARGAQPQQAALDAWLGERLSGFDPNALAVIAEGAFFELHAPPGVRVLRLAVGCVCCVGHTPLRVSLTRLLSRNRPSALLLILASDDHLPRVRLMLKQDFADALQLA